MLKSYGVVGWGGVPLFLGFWVWGLGVWGLGLTIYNVKLRQAQILFTELSNIKDKSFAGCCEIAVKAARIS